MLWEETGCLSVHPSLQAHVTHENTTNRDSWGRERLSPYCKIDRLQKVKMNPGTDGLWVIQTLQTHKEASESLSQNSRLISFCTCSIDWFRNLPIYPRNSCETEVALRSQTRHSQLAQTFPYESPHFIWSRQNWFVKKGFYIYCRCQAETLHHLIFTSCHFYFYINHCYWLRFTSVCRFCKYLTNQKHLKKRVTKARNSIGSSNWR